ncbi:MAG: UDP-N-acetylmuramate--L-alanine ligase [Bacilli bacterium]|nr:UDP-N-acetylmuramate--L-alanine ligase [Bacilli bacterium]
MKYYCIGIKGAGMSTLAEILYDLGNTVIGYDDNKNHVFTEEGLEKRNIKIFYDQNHILDDDLIVTYSAAFSDEHPEIKRIKEKGLKVVSYNELLGNITNMFETTCVAGTHGKTTTSLLISHILKNTIGTNYFVGDGSGFASKENETFIIESCEYNKHFLAYHPYNAVITNIELEHVECYDGLDDIINTFSEFSNKCTNMVVACGDNENIRKMNIDKKIIYYGFNENNDMYAKNIILSESGSKFDVYYNDKFYDSFDIPLYGKHMILNTLATIIICDSYQISKEDIQKYLKTFVSPKRRFKETVIKNNVIIDDYAHHPTEIKVTLEAARQKYPNKELVAVFKPNTYTRTKALYKEFSEALNIADKAYVTDIYCDREKKEDYPDVTSSLIIDLLNNGELINENEIDKLLIHDNAVIVFMSCKNIYIMKERYEELLENS